MPLMASVIAHALAVSRCSFMRDSFSAACLSVRFSGRFSQQYFVPFRSLLFSSEDFASRHLTLSVTFEASCIAWKRSMV